MKPIQSVLITGANAGLGREADVVERDTFGRLVAQAHVVEADVAAHALGRPGAAVDLGGLVEGSEDAVGGGNALLERRQHVRQALERRNSDVKQIQDAQASRMREIISVVSRLRVGVAAMRSSSLPIIDWRIAS